MKLHSVVRGLWRTANAGGASLLGIALLAGCVGGSVALPSAGPTAAPTASPSASPSAGPTASAGPGSGGEVVVGIPAPAPVVCTPAAVSVPVGQRAVLNCSSQGYFGPFTLTLDNPAVASVQPVTGTNTFFYVYGLQAGTATLSFAFSGGGTGSVGITVTP
jgi:hypothetical protein